MRVSVAWQEEFAARLESGAGIQALCRVARFDEQRRPPEMTLRRFGLGRPQQGQPYAPPACLWRGGQRVYIQLARAGLGRKVAPLPQRPQVGPHGASSCAASSPE